MYQIDKTLQIILRDIKDTIQKNQEEKKSLKPEHFVYSSGRLKRHNVKIQEMLESYLEGLQEMKRNRKSDFFKWIKFNLSYLNGKLKHLKEQWKLHKTKSELIEYYSIQIENCKKLIQSWKQVGEGKKDIVDLHLYSGSLELPG